VTHPSPITHHYLGIDFGTSGARAIAIDSSGAILAEARLVFSDQTAESWRAALFDLIGQIPADIRRALVAIAINGTSTTALLCDADNLPLCPPLLYNDARAQTEAKQLALVAPSRNSVLSASSSLAKLLWFQKQPEFYYARFFVHQADWLASLLHGKAGISDYHNSLKLGYNPATMRYPEWLLRLAVAPSYLKYWLRVLQLVRSPPKSLNASPFLATASYAQAPPTALLPSSPAVPTVPARL